MALRANGVLDLKGFCSHSIWQSDCYVLLLVEDRSTLQKMRDAMAESFVRV
jgi:hypothetical protein